jgi:DNA-binding transcriptional ArsR family regulator
MPVLNEAPVQAGPQVMVRASLVVELEWALASAGRPDYLRDHPTLGTLYGADPDLQRRVGELWGEEDALSFGCFLELLVLAHHGGLLFSMDPEALFERFDALCAAAPGDVTSLPLMTESDADRQAVYRRLAKLRDSAELRRRYLAVARDVWAAVRPDWERWGRGAVETEVAARRDLLARGADWHEVSRLNCDHEDLLGRTVAALGPDGVLAVVPAFFTHHGLLVDLPGLVVAGVRADTSAAEARARTEAVARRLKTISDPTRLAILDALRRGPRTVTELATSFALAQPTVSNHVKLLRDAGLVADRREGTRRNLVVQHDVVADMLANLQGLLGEHSLLDDPLLDDPLLDDPLLDDPLLDDTALVGDGAAVHFG